MSKCKLGPDGVEKEDVNVDLLEHDNYSVTYRFKHEGTIYIFKAYRKGKDIRVGLIHPSKCDLNGEDVLYQKAAVAGEDLLTSLGLHKRHIGAKLFNWFFLFLAVIYISAVCASNMEISGVWNICRYVGLPIFVMISASWFLAKLYHKNK